MVGSAFLIFLFDTLLGCLLFLAVAGLAKAWAEHEQEPTYEPAPSESPAHVKADSEA